jgi:A/G-specific adenine glycosylase
MLQQTQAARVEPIFEAFLHRFPDVVALAGGSRADVLRAWSGLGYNRRAVRLHEAARAVVRDHGGRIPRDVSVLARLPGVGPYTAAAVASIGFGLPAAAVDTNVRRVVARVMLGAEPDDVPERDVLRDAERWLDRRDPATWNQALMDLGRACCRPQPRCVECPLARICRFARSGGAPRVPARRQPPFAGSDRQVRGAVVRALRGSASLDRAGLVTAVGHPASRVADVLPGLVRDGLVERTRTGRLRLPR